MANINLNISLKKDKSSGHTLWNASHSEIFSIFYYFLIKYYCLLKHKGVS